MAATGRLENQKIRKSENRKIRRPEIQKAKVTPTLVVTKLLLDMCKMPPTSNAHLYWHLPLIQTRYPLESLENIVKLGRQLADKCHRQLTDDDDFSNDLSGGGKTKHQENLIQTQISRWPKCSGNIYTNKNRLATWFSLRFFEFSVFFLRFCVFRACR